MTTIFSNGCCGVLISSPHTNDSQSQLYFSQTIFFKKIVYFISMSNVKKIGDDSYFLFKITLLRTSASSRRLGHVTTLPKDAQYVMIPWDTCKAHPNRKTNNFPSASCNILNIHFKLQLKLPSYPSFSASHIQSNFSILL